MSSSHRIALKTNWKLERTKELDDPEGVWVRLSRSFHRPTGLSTEQEVFFRFETVVAGVRLSLNDNRLPLTIMEGLATATFTGMMQSINRVEIRWRVESFDAFQSPEHLVAWLEILDRSPPHS